MDLTEIRGKLDEVDAQLVRLFEERMRLCGVVAEIKKETGKKVYDQAREREKLKTVQALAENDFDKKCVEELFMQMMSMSRKLQYKKLAESRERKLPFIPVDALDMDAHVVFQGAEGSYSQAATEAFFGKKAHVGNVETFRDAMLVLEEGSAAFAVLPIENSTAGIVSEIYDLLAEFEHFIVGEQMVRIEHCLLGAEGTTPETIRTVYSHPQSLMQCEHFLRQHPAWEQVSMKNNAFAARKVAEEKNPAQAAIAGAHAAEAYGLKILERGINQASNNTTRFIVVSNQKIFLKTAHKISLCFEVPHESGSLYRILSHFIYNDLNMTKIESRPIEDRTWEYRFFLDFEGNLSDAAVRNAICGLREETRNLR
ncbi:MAG: prephenate dehydratase, partial [Lachnospiraceae bacterium]|nr:prephenate dehydratase [Lachnospiraceae bacterium]